MLRQHAAAVKSDYTFLRTAKQVRDLAASDRLEDITGTYTYLTDGVSFPYARPVVKLFIERLAAQYFEATGSPLIITSLTRPTTLQPRNASPLSVHPTGMAVDLRVPSDAAARGWLERALLSLEDKGVLDVTREHSPSHYHIAVFPDAYASYVATVTNIATQTVANLARGVHLPARIAAAMTVTTQGGSDATPSRSAMLLTLALVGIGTLCALSAALLVHRRTLVSRIPD